MYPRSRSEPHHRSSFTKRFLPHPIAPRLSASSANLQPNRSLLNCCSSLTHATTTPHHGCGLTLPAMLSLAKERASQKTTRTLASTTGSSSSSTTTNTTTMMTFFSWEEIILIDWWIDSIQATATVNGPDLSLYATFKDLLSQQPSMPPLPFLGQPFLPSSLPPSSCPTTMNPFMSDLSRTAASSIGGLPPAGGGRRRPTEPVTSSVNNNNNNVVVAPITNYIPISSVAFKRRSLLTALERRDHHTNSERKRRYNYRVALDRLANVLPRGMHNDKNQHHLLQRAVLRIKELERSIRDLNNNNR